MDELTQDDSLGFAMEILPPEREEVGTADETVVCLCCRRRRSRFAMDDDGCGICNECLEA